MTRQIDYYLCRPIKQDKYFKTSFVHFLRCLPHGSSLWNFCTKIKPILDHNSLCNDPWHFPLTGFSMLEPSILCMALSHRLHHAACMVVTSSGGIGQSDTIEVTNIWHPAHIYWHSAKCHAWHSRDMSWSLLHVTDTQHHGQDGASGV